MSAKQNDLRRRAQGFSPSECQAKWGGKRSGKQEEIAGSNSGDADGAKRRMPRTANRYTQTSTASKDFRKGPRRGLAVQDGVARRARLGPQAGLAGTFKKARTSTSGRESGCWSTK